MADRYSEIFKLYDAIDEYRKAKGDAATLAALVTVIAEVNMPPIKMVNERIMISAAKQIVKNAKGAVDLQPSGNCGMNRETP